MAARPTRCPTRPTSPSPSTLLLELWRAALIPQSSALFEPLSSASPSPAPPSPAPLSPGIPSPVLLSPVPDSPSPPLPCTDGVSAADTRACDNCAEPAAVFCRADAAALCGACDMEVHSANRLARRHLRVPLPSPPSPLPQPSPPVPALALSVMPEPVDLALALQAGACIEREAAALARSSGASLAAASAQSAASASALSVVSSAETVATEHASAALTARRRKARAEALARFRAKRARRSFAHRVRYACRKTLADQRPRVKGRFVNKNELELYLKYGDKYQLFLHQIAQGGNDEGGSAGSSILTDAPTSPDAFYNPR